MHETKTCNAVDNRYLIFGLSSCLFAPSSGDKLSKHRCYRSSDPTGALAYSREKIGFTEGASTVPIPAEANGWVAYSACKLQLPAQIPFAARISDSMHSPAWAPFEPWR